MKLLIILAVILPPAVGIYSYNLDTLTNFLDCDICSNSGRTFSSFRYNNTFNYSVKCQIPGGNSTFRVFTPGLYYVQICGINLVSSNLFCPENGIFPSIDSDMLAGATLTCMQSFESLLLLTISSLCEDCSSVNCSQSGVCGSSTSSQCSGTGSSSMYNGMRCQAQLLSNITTQGGACTQAMPRCCYFNCENITCVNQPCEVASSSNIPASTYSPMTSIVPTSSMVPTFSMVPTSSIVPTPTISSIADLLPTTSIVNPGSTVFPTPSTTVTTNLQTNGTTLGQDAMLILVTVIPAIGIIAVVIAFIVIILVIICVKCRKKVHNSPIKNYADLNGNDISGLTNNVVNNNANFEMTDNTNRQTNETREPVYYSVIPENRLSVPNDYVYASYNSLEIQKNPNLEKQTSKKKKEGSFGGSYQYVVNELYSELVDGEVMDKEMYEELQSDKPRLFSTSDSLEINSMYQFNQENTQPVSPYIEPSKSISELEHNFQCCPFQIRKEELELGERIASGHFGLVYRATYHTHKGDIPVAVKSLKQEANSDMTLAFMREAATLAQFNHPNVLRLIGVLSPQHQQPCMIVTELLRTELREFLLKLKHPNSGSSSSTRSSPQPQGVVLQALLLKFSQEIAAGMAYLAEKKFIHRDLAARNVLVAKDLTIRVADFGMSREMDSPENNYYTSSGGKVPLRWTAPEALLYMKYSEKSDVWAFGMTLYEIWSLGDKPWGSASNEEIIEALSTGRILSAPFGCPEDLYQVMMQTWTMEKTGRPTFNELKTILSNVNLSFYHKLSEIQ